MVDGRYISTSIIVVGLVLLGLTLYVSLVLLGLTLYPRHEMEEPVVVLPLHPVKIKTTPASTTSYPRLLPVMRTTATTFTLPHPVSPGPVIDPSHCPRRYLHTNTHVYGRHHNQFQESRGHRTSSGRLSSDTSA